MTLGDALSHIVAGRNLTREQAREVIGALMSGETSDARAAALLTAWHIKGESVDELIGATEAMRALATRVAVDPSGLVDTCGTGGSGAAKLFNVSTAAAFVAAAAGVRVAKHGNRAASSSSGSADVLEAAGAAITLGPAEVARCIDEVGVGFLFAAAHHGAMKHLAGVRRELGFRTLYNLLGPLTNPAGARRQLIGVFDPRWQQPMAEVLAALGSEHALIVHSAGLDELGLEAPSEIVELRHGVIERYPIAAEDVGLARRSHRGLAADSPAASLELVKRALAEVDDAAGELVAFNAGAAIYVGGAARNLSEGVAMAQDAQASGLARERFDEFVRVTALMAETR